MEKNNKDRPDWNWLGRNLSNYKEVHAHIARDKGLEQELKAAKTLTQAKKILFGYKRGNKK